MKCAVHTEVDASWTVDGQPACDACAREAEARSRDLGAGLIASVGAAYLATLAIGFLVFHARPLIGGLAAVVAIVLGRLLAGVLKRPVLRRSVPRT
ncbi:MAG: hypothetical protein JST00_37050 [Deltaproteobacteria bacterium]|nr:hypothetical protein [Deltaproteobacteria bacterium]